MAINRKLSSRFLPKYITVGFIRNPFSALMKLLQLPRRHSGAMNRINYQFNRLIVRTQFEQRPSSASNGTHKVTRLHTKGVATEIGELTFEGDHRVTCVRDGNFVQSGDAAGNLIRAEEAKDAELGQPSVVQLGDQAALLGLLGHVLVEAKGIVQVEDGVDVVPEQLEGRELARLAAAHVVGEGAAAALVPELEGGDDGKDLPLGSEGDGVPLLLGAEVGAGMGSSGQSLGPLKREGKDIKCEDIIYLEHILLVVRHGYEDRAS